MVVQDTVRAIASALSSTKSIDEETYLDQIVESMRNDLGFHFVGLYLVVATKRLAIFRAGTGEMGKKLRLLEHKFSLDSPHNGPLVIQVIKNGEFQAHETKIVPPDYWYHKAYKCLLPLEIQPGSPLKFQVEETEPISYRFQSATIPPPPQLEICVPMRISETVVGALHLLILEESLFAFERMDKTGEHLQWMLDKVANTSSRFSLLEEDCSSLQWVADQIAMQLELRGITNSCTQHD